MFSIPSSEFSEKAACFVEEEEKLTLKYGQEVAQKEKKKNKWNQPI